MAIEPPGIAPSCGVWRRSGLKILAKATMAKQVVFTLAQVAPEFANVPILGPASHREPLFECQGPFRRVPNDQHSARSISMIETLEIVRLQNGGQPRC